MSRESILLVGNYSNKTGFAWHNIYRLFNEIAQHMHARGVGVCLSFAEYEQPLGIIDEAIPSQVLEFDPHQLSLGSLRELAAFIRRENIRYVYLTDQRGIWWFYALLRLLGVKRIIVHSRVSVADPKPMAAETGIKKLVKSLLGSIPLLTPSRIYAVSSFVRDRLVHKNCLPENRVEVILNGIDTEKFKAPAKAVDPARIEIFVCGRATREKGILTLIEAAGRLRNERELCNFHIAYAGDGPEMPLFKRRVQELGLAEQFSFLGELNGTVEQLHKADLVVVPSEWGDACPSSVSEALASGRPLVATRAGGIPEMIGGADNALLVEPGDAEALADALAQLMQNESLRQRLSTNAQQRAAEALDQRRYYRDMLQQLDADLA